MRGACNRVRGDLMGVAQLVEQRSPKPRVEGSSPSACAVSVRHLPRSGGCADLASPASPLSDWRARLSVPGARVARGGLHAGEAFYLCVEGLQVSWSDPDRNYGPPLSKRVKRDVLRAHAGVCHWCGKPGGDEVDHVLNRRAGGSDDPSNLAPIHKYPCHSEKTQLEAQRGRRGRSRREPPEHPGRSR